MPEPEKTDEKHDEAKDDTVEKASTELVEEDCNAYEHETEHQDD
jgi:hypothetical protein